MDRGGVRYRVATVLLGADAPRTLAEIVRDASAARPAVLNALWDMVEEGVVVEGALLSGRPGPQYCWHTRWRTEAGNPRKAKPSGERPPRDLSGWPRELDLGGEIVSEFHDFVVRRYEPPPDKRLLVLFQCSVRRPFSKSPSHASLRRAVRTATGFDPARQFTQCPVHVVVLASRIGPVPYELEDFYPANVRSGGVKHFAGEHYERARPVLTRRLADYLVAHAGRYDRVAAFGDSRYGQIMRDAAELAGRRFPVFPDPEGERVLSIGTSRAQNYWQKYWIQLHREVAGWLPQAQAEDAERRLEALGLESA
jgi:hypothetical protein